MDELFTRSEIVLGSEELKKLKSSRVLLFGIGGVGSYTAEALVRSGIGSITIVDNDVVTLSNCNRQLLALHSSVGRSKVDVMAERLRDINPDVLVTCHKVFVLPENIELFDFASFDYVADAIDTVLSKVAIIEKCFSIGVPVISSMGTGNKRNPANIKISDIYDTSVCPLARVMRHELRKRNVTACKVVWSDETPAKKIETSVTGSLPFVTGTAGLMMAGEIINTLSGDLL